MLNPERGGEARHFPAQPVGTLPGLCGEAPSSCRGTRASWQPGDLQDLGLVLSPLQGRPLICNGDDALSYLWAVVEIK